MKAWEKMQSLSRIQIRMRWATTQAGSGARAPRWSAKGGEWAGAESPSDDLLPVVPAPPRAPPKAPVARAACTQGLEGRPWAVSEAGFLGACPPPCGVS